MPRGKKKKLGTGQVEREPKEKAGPRQDFAGVHAVRSLRAILASERPTTDEEIILAVKHWLMDESHTHRLTRDFESQQIISKLLADLDE